jgi:hypothetical protein
VTGITRAFPPIPAADVPAGAAAQARDRWVDRFAGSDPGLNRFRMPLRLAGLLAQLSQDEQAALAAALPAIEALASARPGPLAPAGQLT